MEKSKALAVPDAAQIELAYRAIVDGEPVDELIDSEAVQRALLQQHQAATTADELLSPDSLPAWTEFLDRGVELRRIRLNPSQFDGASAAYIIADIVDLETGEAVTVHCGGRSACVKAVKLWELGELPVRCALVEAGKGRNGRSAPLTLVGLDPNGAPLRRQATARR